MSESLALIWFRNDLRIEDNPALAAARETGAAVVGLYILDETMARPPGAASRWWLHHSLKALGGALEKAGTRLILRRGDAAKILPELVRKQNAKSVFWNRRYYGPHIGADKAMKARLTGDGVRVETFNGSLLREPWELKTGSGGPYRVFTPYWKSLQEMGPARTDPPPRLHKIEGPDEYPQSDRLDGWNLPPAQPNWAKEFETVWSPGENGARKRLHDFLGGGGANYADGRDRPDCDYTSRLSPHLAFGEISPLTLWRATHARMQSGDVAQAGGEKFLSEVAWRDFSANLLFNNPEMPAEPLRAQFANYPWRNDVDALNAWRKGRTGYPIVDAGMRQLWRTGWMHNRVRMIVASFLVKDLLIEWQDGAAWFWDTLVDADLANNAAGWQWVAGCGADAAPYFRIFNPVSQGEKFDPDGAYIRKFVPELSRLPAKHIHAPWRAAEEILQQAGVTLGKTYPNPIVDHDQARRRALEGYDRIRGE